MILPKLSAYRNTIPKNKVIKMSQLEYMSLSEQEESQGNIPENNPDKSLAENEPAANLTPEEAQAAVEGGSARQPHHHEYEAFLKDLEKLPDSDAKLQFAIQFMENSLAQSGTPHFKSFWEARSICLQLFKENISPLLRSALWTKYNELSKEARRLKEILDEQSAFAVEQIEMAVKALEADIAAFEDHLQKMPAEDFGLQSPAMAERKAFYQDLQRKLNLLNTYASRINALRKELIRTEMRVRQKNKFFQRLSAAGDLVFPRRKDFIKEVSDAFISDVDAFIAAHFTDQNFHDSLFSLREEIKALQNLAKLLTLNTHSFTHTRMRLSECWDRIKNEEKERKKERAQLKAAFKQNYDESAQRIQAFAEAYAAQPMSTGEAMKQLDEISSYVRSLELGRDEKQALRDLWNAARKPVQEKMHAEEQARQQHDLDRENHRRQKIQDLRNEAEALTKNHQDLDADGLTQARDELIEKINNAQMSKAEKQDLERQLKPLRDLISEKKESSLLKLSDDDRQSLQQLREVLKQRKERRQEIREQIDTLRKASGASGLDFEQAMNQNAQIEAEKERLDKINQGISEIEQKIADLVDN